MRRLGTILTMLSLLVFLPGRSEAVRVKDLVQVEGVRSNHLVGYGLVVGLSGTGDTRRSSFTNQSLTSLLRRMGLNVDPSRLDVTNTAAVMVTAELPPYSKPGEKIDVVVSAMGDARSLEGGTLLMTPVRGPDNTVYVVGQGPVSVGGYASGHRNWSRLRRNVPTVGRIPSGGLVERAIPTRFIRDDIVTLTLREADFTTASRIVTAINTALNRPLASASGPGEIKIALDAEAKKSPVAFVASIELVDVVPDNPARVVVNERTGTVVVGGNVSLGAAAVAHGNLDVSIEVNYGILQPTPFAPGGAVMMPVSRVNPEEAKPKLTEIPATTTVNGLVQALNALGASPRDLIAVLQALKTSGALHGALTVQ
ncbi:MAG: flagellar biosynthesis protein FlgA [Myxococcales bacterium]|nr:flagellar biosynthesis protein FlgA [Myxococcales bacterium]